MKRLIPIGFALTLIGVAVLHFVYAKEVHAFTERFPVWFWGFAIVTSLLGYGVTGRFAWRRSVRRERNRQGLCIHCGYDLRSSLNQCPECGTVINRA